MLVMVITLKNGSIVYISQKSIGDNVANSNSNIANKSKEKKGKFKYCKEKQRNFIIFSQSVKAEKF